MKTVDDYLAALRRALADLPPQELEAVLEDVTPQLLDSDPAELRPPAEYAAELRAAAGYERSPDRLGARLSLVLLAIGTITAAYAGLLGDHLVSNDARYSMPVIFLALLASAVAVRNFGPTLWEVMALPEVAAVRGVLPAESTPLTRYLASLLPGWFALQGFLVGLAGYLIIVRLGWLTALALVFAVVLAALVTAAGQRSLRDRRWLWVSLPAGAFAVGFMVHLAIAVRLR